MITDNGKRLTHKDISDWHKNDRTWLSVALEEGKNNSIIVMTHHLPSFKLIHKDYQGIRYNKYSSGFASDCDDLIRKSSVWIFGHSHIPVSFELEGCKCFSNPLGYKDEGNVTDFLTNASFNF